MLFNSDCKELKVIRRPTLGYQPIVLGSLFTEVEDKFLPGLTLWKEEDIKNYTKTIFHPRQQTQWTNEQTLDEKLNMLQIDISGSISLDIKASMLSASGSFHYLDKKQVLSKLLIILLI